MPSPREASPKLQTAMDDVAGAVNRTIERLLPETDLPEAPLYDAMRHGTLATSPNRSSRHRSSGLSSHASVRAA